MIRYSLPLLPVAALLLGVSSNHASGQVEPTCLLAQELRAAFGFDARTLATLDVSTATFTSVLNAALTHVDQNRETLEPLILAVREARQDVFKAYESFDHDAEEPDDTAIDAAETALASARSALKAAVQSHLDAMTALLPAAKQTVHARVEANATLDRPSSLLDLTAEQRSAIQDSQRVRDKVARHCKLRKHYARVASAHQDHNSAVEAELTGAQQAALIQLNADFASGFAALKASEDATCD